LPVAFAPLLVQPIAAIGFVAAVAGGVLAFRSVAYPLALSALFAVLIGILGRNPFPNGVIAKLSFVWVLTAIVFAAVREDYVSPVRGLVTAPVLPPTATALA